MATMKTIKQLLFSIAISTLTLGQVLADGNECITEKKKTITKIYTVSSKDNLLIDNQFGSVKVNLWNKNEIRVEIIIKADSPSDERAQKRLDAISIEEKNNGDQISLKTTIEDEGYSGWFKSSNGNNTIQIDYVVSMPKNIPLSVKNRFGNTDIPTFNAPLTIKTSYGNFTANDLMGNKTDIDVNFGKAIIQEMGNGSIDMGYSTLSLDKGNTIHLVNKFGKFHIGDVDKIDGKVSYSNSSHIKNVKNSCVMKLSFSSGFAIEQMPASADNVDITASYSSVSIPTENCESSFDVVVSHGDFKYPTNRTITFTQNDDNDKKGYTPTKKYVGRLGNGNGTKIRIVSSFGDVRLR
jgi:hypothetical protein